MKLLPLLPLIGLSLTLASAADSQPKPLLAERGKMLYSADLTATPDAKEWKAAKGKWEAASGALQGAEIPEDKHGAVTRHTMSFKDAVIQFEFKLDGAKGTSLSINDAKGHIARVSISPTGFTVQKDDHDHEGPDKAAIFGRRAVPFARGEWHTVVAEFVGDTMLATVDGANPTFGSSEMLATEKANLGFTVAGQTASFRNLRVWAATANKDWEKTKATIPPAPMPAVVAKKKPAA